MMIRTATLSILTAAVLALSSMPGLAEAREENPYVTKKSVYSVAETVDRLEAAVTDAGATVIARVDHAAAAAGADLELRPTQVLIFGNPSAGTRLMQIDQRIALDLPMKVLVFQAEDDTVYVRYVTPIALLDRYNLDGGGRVADRMTRALDRFTGVATGANN